MGNIFDRHKKKAPSKLNETGIVRRPLPTKKEVSSLTVPGEKLLLYRVLPCLVTKGGLHIPHDALDASQVEYPHMGVVLVAGTELDSSVFAYGTFIYYNQFGGRRFVNQATEQECIMVNIDDVMVIDNKFKGYDEKCVLIMPEVIDTEKRVPPTKSASIPGIILPENGIIN